MNPLKKILNDRFLTAWLIAACFTTSASVQAEDLLQKIKNRKKLINACDPFSPPMWFPNAPDGNDNGIEANLMNFIAKEIGPDIEAEIQTAKWERVPEIVHSGKADLAICQITVDLTTIDKQKDVLSEPYYESGLAIAYWASAPEAKDLNYFKDKTGSTWNQDGAITSLRSQGIYKFKTFESETQMYETLHKKKVDFIAYDLPLLGYFVSQSKGKYRLYPSIVPGTEWPYRVLMRAESKDLIQLVNQAIKKWRALPETKALIEQYRK